MDSISKKRIFLALLPLIIFNFIFALDIFVFKKSAWSQVHDPYEWDENERLYTSTKSQTVSSNGQPLFSYEGQDANCWEYEKAWQRDQCLNEHPYGGQGTMIMEGNLEITNAQALYLNGYDSAGYNWLMSSSTEVMGNALATQRDNTEITHGNHMLADGSMTGGSIGFTSADATVSFVPGEADAALVEIGEVIDKVVYSTIIDDQQVNALQILEKGICGMCDGRCGAGFTGRGYTFVSEEGIQVKGTVKVNQQMRHCGSQAECQEKCCRELQYLTDDTYDNFIGDPCNSAQGFDPWCINETPPENCYAHDYSARPECTYCYPQPYMHYTEVGANLDSVYETDGNGNRVRRGSEE
ncbi:hypothetical protein C0583_00870 [Candidatus Parcubacteria bacterium]|nr:MAG: hypothetical protein C0583_00870 [Candidatus Parcubacteria bacterium]